MSVAGGVWVARCSDCGSLRALRDLVEVPGGAVFCARCDEKRDPIRFDAEEMHALEEVIPDPCAEVCS